MTFRAENRTSSCRLASSLRAFANFRTNVQRRPNVDAELMHQAANDARLLAILVTRRARFGSTSRWNDLEIESAIANDFQSVRHDPIDLYRPCDHRSTAARSLNGVEIIGTEPLPLLAIA